MNRAAAQAARVKQRKVANQGTIVDVLELGILLAKRTEQPTCLWASEECSTFAAGKRTFEERATFDAHVSVEKLGEFQRSHRVSAELVTI